MTVNSRFIFKKNIPIYDILGNTIALGVGANYLEIPKNLANIKLIEDSIELGFNLSDIERNSILKSFYERNFFTIQNKEVSLDIRNDLYFEQLELSPLTKEKLSNKILVFGAGGVGSIVTYLLTQWGFNNLAVVDYDIVESSDIKKTTIYRNEHLGKDKVLALKEIISDNFNIEITTIRKKITDKKDIEQILIDTEPSLVVYGIDPKPILKFDFNELCFRLKIPYLIGAYSNQFVRLGPLCVPGLTNCLESFGNYLRQNNCDTKNMIQLFKNHYLHPSVSFNISILGGLMVKDILFYFQNEFNFVSSYNKIINFNPLTFEGSKILLKCENNCTVCN